MAEDTSPMSAEKDELMEDASCKNIVIEPIGNRVRSTAGRRPSRSSLRTPP